jgi:hypothetical protein
MNIMIFLYHFHLHNVSKLTCYAARRNITEFAKLHMGLVVLVEKMSVLINFLLQNTNLVSVCHAQCSALPEADWTGLTIHSRWKITCL